MNMMLELYILCSLVAMILLIWFRTESFIEYCRLFNLNWISFYKDYDAKKKEDAKLTYLGYLRQYHDSFFARLITCPICASIWISILLAILTLKMSIIPVVVIGGLLLFSIIDRLLE